MADTDQLLLATCTGEHLIDKIDVYYWGLSCHFGR